MALDRELQKYYEDYFDLFSRPGWKMFEEELGETLQNLRDKMETTTEPLMMLRSTVLVLRGRRSRQARRSSANSLAF